MERKPHVSRRGWLSISLLLLVIVGAVGWEQVNNRILHPSKADTDQHAQVAANVMGRGRSDRPVMAVLYDVVGDNKDTKIEALKAQGTTNSGTAVLRITVTIINHEGTFAERTDRTQACYQYVFERYVTFHKLSSCPDSPVLTITAPASTALPQNASDLLQQTLSGLPTDQWASIAAIEAAVTVNFPSPARVLVEGDPAKQVDVYIHSGEQCLTGYVFPDRVLNVGAVNQGDSCFGG